VRATFKNEHAPDEPLDLFFNDNLVKAGVGAGQVESRATTAPSVWSFRWPETGVVVAKFWLKDSGGPEQHFGSVHGLLKAAPQVHVMVTNPEFATKGLVVHAPWASPPGDGDASRAPRADGHATELHRLGGGAAVAVLRPGESVRVATHHGSELVFSEVGSPMGVHRVVDAAGGHTQAWTRGTEF